jgi:hypothetical protein
MDVRPEPAKCPAIRDNHVKPDGMIDGREGGPAPGYVRGAWTGRAIYRRHLIFKVTGQTRGS